MSLRELLSAAMAAAGSVYRNDSGPCPLRAGEICSMAILQEFVYKAFGCSYGVSMLFDPSQIRKILLPNTIAIENVSASKLCVFTSSLTGF